MKVKVSVNIKLKDIPQNCIYVDIPDDVSSAENYATSLIREQLENTDIAIADENHIIPKQLIESIDIKSFKIC